MFARRSRRQGMSEPYQHTACDLIPSTYVSHETRVQRPLLHQSRGRYAWRLGPRTLRCRNVVLCVVRSALPGRHLAEQDAIHHCQGPSGRGWPLARPDRSEEEVLMAKFWRFITGLVLVGATVGAGLGAVVLGAAPAGRPPTRFPRSCRCAHCPSGPPAIRPNRSTGPTGPRPPRSTALKCGGGSSSPTRVLRPTRSATSR